MNKDLAHLRELTKNLPEMVIAFHLIDVEYEVENGTCFGHALLHNPKVAVQLAIMSKGAKFPFHVHEADEHLIVYKGSMAVSFEDKCVTLYPGDAQKISAGVQHRVVAPEECRMIGITIPADMGYPGE